jgi:hypothetical protein
MLETNNEYKLDTIRLQNEELWRITKQKTIEIQIKRRKWNWIEKHYIKKQEQQRKPYWIGILRGIEEEVGQRERGEG